MKYEYTHVEVPCMANRYGDATRLIERINRLGKEGWELVSVTQHNGEYTAFLKRLIP